MAYFFYLHHAGFNFELNLKINHLIQPAVSINSKHNSIYVFDQSKFCSDDPYISQTE